MLGREDLAALEGSEARVRLAIAIDSAKALVRAKPSAEQREKATRRLTELEDWLELAHPRWPERGRLRQVRRRLE